MKNFLIAVLAVNTLLLVGCQTQTTLPPRNVTFLSTSDLHCRERGHVGGNHNDLNLASIGG